MFELRYTSKAIKDIKKLRQSDKKRIIKQLEQLVKDPFNLKTNLNIYKMRDFSEHEYRLRIGQYRVGYDLLIKDKVILILAVKPRGSAYKK
jgi:mRNA interferase RelE/StbE